MGKIEEIAKHFNFEGTFISYKENNQGNINKTYILTYDVNGKQVKYLIQEINVNVFKEPFKVMSNIELVTEHIIRKLKEVGDTERKTLDIIRTVDGKNMYVCDGDDGHKKYYRAFNFIDNCISYNNLNESDNPKKLAYDVGRSFGFFQKMLSDFPVNKLYETIKNFHNIRSRYNDFEDSIRNSDSDENLKKRKEKFSNEIEELRSLFNECCVIDDSLANGNIPIRVTHNDPKLNNFLMVIKTDKGVMIDFDTVMPGSYLYDLGDGVRSACSSSSEDETDSSKVYLDMELTRAYLTGYLDEMIDLLTENEILYIGKSIMIITYELAIRFLTDYLNGDKYFKIKYPEHNADRFRNQFTLLRDIINKIDSIEKQVSTYVKKRTVSQPKG